MLSNDPDVEGDILTATLVSDVSNGALTFNPDGSFTYLHDGSETISDNFTYQAYDGADLSNIATVTITVNPVNDPPVANDDAVETDEGTPVTISVTGNDTDGDGTIDPTSVTIVTPPGNGSVSVEALSGDVTYTPDAGYSGIDTFTYTVNDDDGDTSNEATVTVTVRAVAPAPTDYTMIYLPLVLKSCGAPAPAPTAAPDLVVENIIVTSNSVQVVIENQGDAAVMSENEFWVDLYIYNNVSGPVYPTGGVGGASAEAELPAGDRSPVSSHNLPPRP